MKVSSLGGVAAKLLDPEKDNEQDFHEPSLLPGANGVLFVIHRSHAAGGDSGTLAIYRNGVKKVILRPEKEDLGGPVWFPSGHIIYRRDRTGDGLGALPFSLTMLEAGSRTWLRRWRKARAWRPTGRSSTCSEARRIPAPSSSWWTGRASSSGRSTSPGRISRTRPSPPMGTGWLWAVFPEVGPLGL